MAKKALNTGRRPVSSAAVGDAMLRRVKQRMAVAGSLKLPAVPSLIDEYVQLCAEVFRAAGRAFMPEELDEARSLLSAALREAFAGSPRSKIVVEFRAESAQPLGYGVTAEISTLADAYERWIGTSEAPLFGALPDARVLALARQLEPPAAFRVLDFGAGTGRNALALARLGFRVDAVEITPKFAQILETEAHARGLPVRVIVRDIFEGKDELADSYGLFIASEVVPDFRSVTELRRLFELAAELLDEGGFLVLNLHVTALGYTPEKSAREFGQQCYSALFTPTEIRDSVAGLPFELLGDDSVFEYEREHLPESGWPPTPWYINWVSGLDVYDLNRETSPVELRWLVYRKLSRDCPTSLPQKTRRPPRVDPSMLREALVRRLMRRATASGTMTLPAIPGLLDAYVELCFATFRALGRDVSTEQLAEGKRLFDEVLRAAFDESQRSNIVIVYEAPMGTDVHYTVSAEAAPLDTVYEEWLEDLPEPLFGVHADARLLALIEALEDPQSSRVLDLGAGTGRNALALARRGHPVDAVEITKGFCERLVREAELENLKIRVIAKNLFDSAADLGKSYRLVLMSGVVADFRGFAELRRVFEMAADVLSEGGWLLLSVHIAEERYSPSSAAREWAQQCAAMFFTRDELARAAAGLSLELVTDDSAHDFERQNLPDAAWPPTEAYPEWALGQHMYALDREDCPIGLRWLLYRKSGPHGPRHARDP